MHDTEILIDAYIQVAENEENSAAYKNNFWAYIAFDECVSNTPAQAYALVLSMLERNLSDRTLSFLAAGPLEDLLSKHGHDIIGRIEKDAKENEALRHALGGMWQNAMSEDIWQHVLKISKARW